MRSSGILPGRPGRPRWQGWLGNLLLSHTKLGSTVRYLGIEVDDALAVSEQVDL
ncbi:hypothetical protein [Lichenicoccus sp.]|uniref:hypothetical protein n=1 Tax=Lichenicoccus sp. TaxID=2781899 RepID=UPI003D0C05B7